jgi:hypothetical protein
MAFNRLDLARVASASTGAQANWLFKTEDDLTTVLDIKYFGEVAPQLRVDDVIQCRLTDRYINLSVLNVDSANNEVITQQIDFQTPLDQQGLVNWRGDWSSLAYSKNDQVIDGGWLMIANKATTDRAAPQKTGDRGFLLPDIPNWDELDNPVQVVCGAKISPAEGSIFSIIGCRIWADVISPNYTYSIWVSIPNSNGDDVLTQLHSFSGDVLTIGWNLVSLDSGLITHDNNFSVWLIIQNSSTGISFDGSWSRDFDDNNNNPPIGSWNKANNETTLRINTTDFNSGNRELELLSITSGSTIEFVDVVEPSRSVAYSVLAEPVLSGDSVVFLVVEINLGPWGYPFVGDLTTMSADIPTPSVTEYVELPD